MGKIVILSEFLTCQMVVVVYTDVSGLERLLADVTQTCSLVFFLFLGR